MLQRKWSLFVWSRHHLRLGSCTMSRSMEGEERVSPTCLLCGRGGERSGTAFCRVATGRRCPCRKAQGQRCRRSPRSTVALSKPSSPCGPAEVPPKRAPPVGRVRCGRECDWHAWLPTGESRQ